MARRPTRSQQRLFAELLARLEPETRAAFEAAAAELSGGAIWADFIAALERQDIEAAVAALRIEPAAYAAYAQAKTAAFVAGGSLTAATIPQVGGLPGIRWDMTNPAAESWIRRHVGERITEVAREQIEAARETILTGYQAGRHPHAIARDVGGRVSRVTGIREGGVLGLDSERARRLAAVVRGMETPEGVRHLVIVGRDGTLRMRYAVNAQTEARILRAYRRGEAVAPADRALSQRQYSNALLKSRAETIARTETGQAVMGARLEQWRQFMAARNIPEEALIRRWVHGGGVKDPRPHHQAMNGQEVRGLTEPFRFSNGAALMCAHDPDGAASETISCTCDTTFRIDQTWGLDQ